MAYALSCVGRKNLVLKPKQEEALIYFYDGQDVLAWFPTGYSKTLCYQLLPFMFDYKLKRTSSPQVERSVVVVLSSLISLMVDQISGLQKEAFLLLYSQATKVRVRTGIETSSSDLTIQPSSN